MTKLISMPYEDEIPSYVRDDKVELEAVTVQNVTPSPARKWGQGVRYKSGIDNHVMAWLFRKIPHIDHNL